MQQYAEPIDQILDFFQAILLSFLIKLGPFFVALMPALFTGYAIFYTFESEAGLLMALLFAGTVGLAMETVGIVSTHTAIDLYNGWSEGRIQAFKAWLMALLVPVYVLGVAGAVWYSENAFTPLVKALGIVSPFLTCIVYIAVALARDLSKTEQKKRMEEEGEQVIKRDERQHKREFELLKLRMEQEKELKRLELEAEVQIELSKAEVEQTKENTSHYQANASKQKAENEQILCSLCGENFETQSALNAHMRKHNPRPYGVDIVLWRKVSYAARNANIRAQECGVEGLISPDDWLKVLQYYAPDGRCLACGEVHSLCLDHVCPLVHGGENIVSNTQPLCKRCNSSKAGTVDYRPDGGQFALQVANRAVNDKAIISPEEVEGTIGRNGHRKG